MRIEGRATQKLMIYRTRIHQIMLLPPGSRIHQYIIKWCLPHHSFNTCCRVVVVGNRLISTNIQSVQCQELRCLECFIRIKQINYQRLLFTCRTLT